MLREAKAKGLKIASVSLTSIEVLRALLQHLVPDMSSYSDLVVSGDDAWRFGNGDRMKPEPDCYLYAKKVLGLRTRLPSRTRRSPGNQLCVQGFWV